ncbi:class I SAM-dependent methyltransferase [Magnetospirillum sp. UT-4]|uniref:class I SAM-dependent methyltransferase n=1 Tax=Magnetospirillum sp. UT-4 TaxID=2681467 RepID=UPI00137D608C|nr:class I SAM-dependent methyltransferase [Magnetospirillum sp. UT-4]CAA7616866.1 SAM-dependent methyltransferase [Magnetospirillum sp. UT-4]
MTINDERRSHWQEVWTSKAPEGVSWYQAEPAASLALIARAGLSRAAGIVDVGGGASLLVDRLLERGHSQVAVLDVSAAALDVAADRLGAMAEDVTWIESDVLEWRPVPGLFELWHDRAVLHFLTRPEERKAYRKVMMAALVPGGWAVLGTFAPDGPEKCSGLPVMRHDAGTLSDLLGPDFDLVAEMREEHVTPNGGVQHFTWCLFRRI